MNKQVGIFTGAALLIGLTGCVSHVDGPRAGYDPGLPQMTVVVQDDYVYYPGYQVYYSSQRHQYTYRDGRAWVTRATPPHVSVDVLAAAPSVPMSFHDFPAQHHATVVREYPKNWAPAANRPSRGNHEEKHGR
ncbi:MAG TPA: hypothetical protein VL527_13535 [Dongiaceae bacterium]|nr:hypothetical protein [Dongiaceae bacterium]